MNDRAVTFAVVTCDGSSDLLLWSVTFTMYPMISPFCCSRGGTFHVSVNDEVVTLAYDKLSGAPVGATGKEGILL